MLTLLQAPWMAAVLGAISYLAVMVLAWPAPPMRLSASAPRDADRIDGPSWYFRNTEMDQLIADLRREKEELAQRERQLKELETRLLSERFELNQVTQTVFRMQQEFDRNVVRITEEEIPNFKRQAKLYASMSPEGAALILKEMEDDQIVKIFSYMKESEVAPILENMAQGKEADTKRAVLLSDRLRLALTRPPLKPTRSRP